MCWCTYLPVAFGSCSSSQSFWSARHFRLSTYKATHKTFSRSALEHYSIASAMEGSVGYAAQRTAMGVISILACLIACRHMRRGKYTHKKAMYCNVLWGQKCNENHAVFKGKCALESQTQLDSRHMMERLQQFALMRNESRTCVSGSSLRCSPTC